MDKTNSQLVLSKRGIDDDGQAVYNTLNQVYHNKVCSYMDKTNPRLVLSKRGIDDDGQAVYNTLNQVYHNKFVVIWTRLTHNWCSLTEE